jgi:hypothetical protein
MYMIRHRTTRGGALSEERKTTTNVRKLAVGAAAVAMLAIFGGVAYAQQGSGQQEPSAQEERNPGGYDCPWERQGGEGESQQTEV